MSPTTHKKSRDALKQYKLRSSGPNPYHDYFDQFGIGVKLANKQFEQNSNTYCMHNNNY